MFIKGKNTIDYKGFDINFSYEMKNNVKLIDFEWIKTKRQQKFRTIESYYNQLNNIKDSKNTTDKWRNVFNETNMEKEEKRLKRENLLLEILGVEKDSLLKAVDEKIKEEFNYLINNGVY